MNEQANGLARVAALVDDYAPVIKRQLECSQRDRCSCTFCEFVEDLRVVVYPQVDGGPA